MHLPNRATEGREYSDRHRMLPKPWSGGSSALKRSILLSQYRSLLDETNSTFPGTLDLRIPSPGLRVPIGTEERLP